MRKFFYFLILMLLISCLPIDKRFSIWIENNSSIPVYFIITNQFPDTLLLEQNYINPFYLNNGSRTSADSNQPWEEVFTTRYPKDTLLIFFFNPDTISKYDWETIVKDYKVMERRAYSKSDLEASNWTITYP